ncbi:MAG: exosortase system-associated protein, TIGR04073 family [Candidatus Omnitrophica bacterium]|nr:exosortase system-associated protein, TIGR04073 family [Candidatus Omnitrophota bacterium]
MKRCLVVVTVTVAAVAWMAVPRSEAAEWGTSGQIFGKLGRGAVNLVTGWVEVPKKSRETMETSGPFIGLTWGVLRGIGYGAVRTAAGLYEVVTFPFPAPPQYEAIVYPEYVFESERGTN